MFNKGEAACRRIIWVINMKAFGTRQVFQRKVKGPSKSRMGKNEV